LPADYYAIMEKSYCFCRTQAFELTGACVRRLKHLCLSRQELVSDRTETCICQSTFNLLKINAE
ncbi:hypothetical protein, partial [Bacteroides heparinolyticus]|uniref:hypothetical protein n=1 Tax=Prevotella heparinolytica TaxID=28113 RepID=UPI0035A140F6